MENLPSRFIILGTPGSGKTTVAKQLENELGLPHYNLDEYLYDENGIIPHERRVKNAEEIAANPKWVAEGNFLYWTNPLIENADHIIWLRTPILIATWRIMKRDVVNRLQRKNKHKFWDTVKFAYGSFLQHRMKYDELSPIDGEISPHIIEKTLEPHKDKVITIRTNKDLKRFFAEFAK